MNKSLIILYLFSLFLLITSCNKIIKQDFKESSNKIDSISIWIQSSKNKSLSTEKRRKFLEKSYKSLKSSNLDSIKTRSLSIISYQYLKLKDTFLFKKLNNETILLANRIKDSFALGDAHWSFATFYNNAESYQDAYYHFNIANLYFEKSGYLKEASITQYGMAFIKGRFKDYSGSEILLFRAIKKFEELNNYKYLYNCYNYLGILQNDIKEYDKALIYYEKALNYVENLNNKQQLYQTIYNNIGNTYLKKIEYKEAIKYFNKILENKNLKKENLESYARVIANKAYSKLLLRDTSNVLIKLKEALKIRDSLNRKNAIVNSKIYLSKYYAYIKDTINAFTYAQDANLLARKLKNGGDYLESLTILAELDFKNSEIYFKKHIQFSDSLQTVDRKTQNKFTRIDYKTDEYIEENKLLNQQKTWISIVSIAFILIMTLLYIINKQKAKNEQLFLENEQQKANEQIYLIKLKQKEKIEIEKIKERNRISEDLHDGILGKLFGTRLGLGFLDIKGEVSIIKKHEYFLKELQVIEEEIREVSHKLNDNFNGFEINFESILKQSIENKANLGGFQFELQIEETINWNIISEVVKINLYRIFQEVTQNIVKYAFAKKVKIQFNIINENIILTITDDGVGFNSNKKKKGIGIKNIKSRVERLNGEFSLNSNLGKGTKIKVKIPF